MLPPAKKLTTANPNPIPTEIPTTKSTEEEPEEKVLTTKPPLPPKLPKKAKIGRVRNLKELQVKFFQNV